MHTAVRGAYLLDDVVIGMHDAAVLLRAAGALLHGKAAAYHVEVVCAAHRDDAGDGAGQHAQHGRQRAVARLLLAVVR